MNNFTRFFLSIVCAFTVNFAVAQIDPVVLNIANPVPASNSAGVGQTFTRQYKICNGALNASLTDPIVVHSNHVDTLSLKILSTSLGMITSRTATGVIITLQPSDFVGATIGTTTMPGNGDMVLDPNECVTITETVLVKTCSNFPVTSTIWAESIGAPDPSDDVFHTTNLAVGVPNLKFSYTVDGVASFTKLQSCFGDKHHMVYKIWNDAAETATNLTINVNTLRNYTTVLFDTSNVTIRVGAGGTPVGIHGSDFIALNQVNYGINSLSAYYNKAFLNGRFKAPASMVLRSAATSNDTIYVEYDYDVDRYQCSDIHLYSSFGANYKNGCGLGDYGASQDNVSSYIYVNVASVDAPSDVIDNQTFDVKVTVSAAEAGNVPKGEAVLELKLPPGLEFTGDLLTTKWVGNTNDMDVRRINYNPATGLLKIHFITQYMAGANTRQSTVTVPMAFHCATYAGGQLNIGAKFYVNTDSTCTGPQSTIATWCPGEFFINPHCPTCDGGLLNMSATFKRQNRCLPDADNDGVNPDGVFPADEFLRLDRAWIGDTMVGTHTGKFFGTGTQYDNVYIWSNLNERYTALKSSIEVHRGGALLFSCGDLPILKSGTQYFSSDFSVAALTSAGCGTVPPGFHYQDGDSVTVRMKYRVTSQQGTWQIITYSSQNHLFAHVGPLAMPLTSTLIPARAIGDPFDQPGKRIQCDNWAGNVQLASIVAHGYMDGYPTSMDCAEVVTNQYVLNYVGGRGVAFPYEIRTFSKPEFMYIVRPPGLTFKGAYLDLYLFDKLYSYDPPVAGTYTLQPDIVKPAATGDTLFFLIKPHFVDAGGVLPVPEEMYILRLRAKWQASCEKDAGIVNWKTGFKLDFESCQDLDFLTPTEITHPSYPPGSDYNLTYLPPFEIYPKGHLTIRGLTNYYEPALNITPDQTTKNITANMACWNIDIQNFSGLADAPNSWLHMESPTGNMTVTSVKDVTAGGTLINFTNDTNSTGFLGANALYPLGNIAKTVTRSFEVCAMLDACKTDSIRVYYGYDCAGYPNGFLNAKCSTRMTLKVVPEPTGIQSNFLKPYATYFDRCTQQQFVIQGKTVKFGDVYNNKMDIILPNVGMSIVSGTSGLQYPNIMGDTSTFGAALPEPVYTHTDVLGKHYLYDLSTFITPYLAGFDNAGAAIYKLKFDVTTDCFYESGKNVRNQMFGESACGDLFSGRVRSKQIKMNAAEAYTTAIEIVPPIPDIFACGSGAQMPVNLTNLGPDPTMGSDSLFVFLPAGLTYTPNSITSISNFTALEPTQVAGAGGSTILKWGLDAGVTVGQLMSLSYHVGADGSMSCDTTTIAFETNSTYTPICNGMACANTVKTITGSLEQDFAVKKPELGLVNFSVSAAPSPATNETLSGNISVKNMGTAPISSIALRLDFYFDGNANGTFEVATDVFLSSQIFSSTLAPGASEIRAFSFLAPAGQTSPILAVLRSDQNPCICTNVAAPSQPLIKLENAPADQAVCTNTPVNWSIPNVMPYIYEWHTIFSPNGTPLATGPNYSPPTDAPGTFTYILKTLNRGFGNSIDTVTLTVYPYPLSAAISGPTGICFGNSTTLTATGGNGSSTYLWSTGETTSAINVAPGSDQTYSVTVTNGSICSAIATKALLVYPLPTAMISGDLTKCSGESSVLTASGGVSYLWSTMANTPAITVSTAGNFTVTATDANGCTDVETVTMTIYPLPTAVISGDLTKCSGESSVLTASGGVSYLWSTMENTPAITVSTAGNFTVTATDANGCTDVETVTMTIYPLPTAVISGDLTKCSGESSVLTASGGVSYLWSTMETTPAITVSTAGNFTVTATDANGCTDVETVTMTIYPLPTALISGDLTKCSGESSVLTASGGVSYLWSTMETTPAITVSTAGNFTVTATDANGCTDVETVTMTIYPLPTAMISGDLTKCSGESSVLTASGGVSYLWSTMETTPAITVSTAGNFTVTATDANGCTDVETVTMTIYPLPTALISGDLTKCSGESSVLTASGGVSYLWSTMANTPAITVSTAGNFTVTATDANGCTDVETVTFNLLPLPVAAISGDLTKCSGESSVLTATGGVSYLWSTLATTAAITAATPGNFTVTVTAPNGCTDSETVSMTIYPLPTATISGDLTKCTGETTSLNASGGISYLWLTNETNSLIYVSTAGLYSVTVTDANGCTDVETAIFIINPLPTASVTSTTACSGVPNIFMANGGVSYLWSTAETTQSITIAALGTYGVTVTDANGCTDDAFHSVNASPIASIFGAEQTCPGLSETFTASGGVSYVWSTTETTPSIVVSMAGTYSVTMTNGNGCTAAASKTLTLNPNPVATITGMDCICDGSSTVFTASGGNNYAWSNGSTNPSISAFSPGTYTVTVTSGSSCTAIGSVTLTLKPAPAMPSAACFVSFCIGDNATLADLNPVGPDILWFDTPVSGNQITNMALPLANGGHYYATQMATNGCESVQRLNVSVKIVTPAPGHQCLGGCSN